MISKIQVDTQPEIWQKLGPWSCLLNIDEVDDVEKTWQQIADKIVILIFKNKEIPVEKVKSSIIPVKELYIILDHTRTILMAITDGALPSNVGGGCNIRNVLRRVFAILKKNDWW